MPTPAETVTDFLALFSRSHKGMLDAIRSCFTEATVWENVGLAVTTGIDEAIALCEQIDATIGAHGIEIEILAIATDGDKVLTERIDRMLRPDGSVIGEPKVMGIFEIEDGKIAAWRDYFDSAAAKESMAP